MRESMKERSKRADTLASQHLHRLLFHSEKLAAVGRVSAAIVQQFNDPLQAITNVLGGIHRRGCIDSEDMELVDLAYRETIKLNKIVRELREFYLPISGRTDLFDVRLELEQIIAGNRPRLADKGVAITTEFAENMPRIHAAAEQLRTVFQSLLENGLETCGRDGTIRFATSFDKDKVVIRITDNGHGIDPSTLSQLFEPCNVRDTKKWTGCLALAKSYAIITMHGGSIEMAVDAGKGSVLKITLPICNNDHTGITENSTLAQKT
jgi:signal transduction histidine kinase